MIFSFLIVLVQIIILSFSDVFCQDEEYQNQCPFFKSFNNICHSGKINGLIYEPKNQLLFSYGDNSELFLWNLSKNQYASLIKNQNTQIIDVKLFGYDEPSLTYLSDDGQLFKFNYLSLVETQYNLPNLQKNIKQKILEEISGFHPCLNILYLRVSSFELVIYDYEKDKILDRIIFDQDNYIKGMSMSYYCTNQNLISDFLWSNQGSLKVINYILQNSKISTIQIQETQIRNEVFLVISNTIFNTPLFVYTTEQDTIEGIMVNQSDKITYKNYQLNLQSQPIHFIVISNRNECLIWFSLDIVNVFSLESFQITQTFQFTPIQNIIQMLQLDDKQQFAILDQKGTINIFNVPQTKNKWNQNDFNPINTNMISSDPVFYLESREQFIIAFTKNRLEREYLTIYNLKNNTISQLSCFQANSENIKVTQQIDSYNSRGLIIDHSMKHFISYQNSEINLWNYQNQQLLMNIEIERDNYFQQVVIWLEEGYIVFITGDQNFITYDYFSGLKKIQFQFIYKIEKMKFITQSDNQHCLISYDAQKVYKFSIITTPTNDKGRDIEILQNSIESFNQSNNRILQCLDFAIEKNPYYVCSLLDQIGNNHALVLLDITTLAIMKKFKLNIPPHFIVFQSELYNIFIYNRKSDALIVQLQTQELTMSISVQKSFTQLYSNDSEIFLIFDENLEYYLVLIETYFLVLNKNLQQLYNDSLKNDTTAHISKTISKFERKIIIFQSYYIVYNRLSILILNRNDFHRICFLELEDISYIKTLLVTEKKILVSTGDQYVILNQLIYFKRGILTELQLFIQYNIL